MSACNPGAFVRRPFGENAPGGEQSSFRGGLHGRVLSGRACILHRCSVPLSDERDGLAGRVERRRRRRTTINSGKLIEKHTVVPSWRVRDGGRRPFILNFCNNTRKQVVVLGPPCSARVPASPQRIGRDCVSQTEVIRDKSAELRVGRRKRSAIYLSWPGITRVGLVRHVLRLPKIYFSSFRGARVVNPKTLPRRPKIGWCLAVETVRTFGPGRRDPKAFEIELRRKRCDADTGSWGGLEDTQENRRKWCGRRKSPTSLIKGQRGHRLVRVPRREEATIRGMETSRQTAGRPRRKRT